MKSIFVTDDFSVDPNEVTSLEHFDHYDSMGPSGGNPLLDYSGTIVIQKNGRKTYLKNLTVKEVHKKIFGVS